MLTKRVGLTILLILVSGFLATHANAQGPTPQPSSDLIFETIPSAPGSPALFRFASDSTITPFYADTGIQPDPDSLRPLKWSPQGDLLAIFRIQKYAGGTPIDQLPLQLCLVDRKGVLQVCFDDKPSAISSGAGDLQDQLSTPDWSATGDKFYFVARSDQTVRLVEADTKTGHSLRTLYQHTGNPVPIIIWTRNLHYVAVGVGERDLKPYPAASLTNLQTNTNLDLNALIPKNAVDRIICPNFSRSSSYITAIANVGSSDVIQSELLIFDKQGTIKNTLGPTTAFGHLVMACPTWRHDEQTLYFYAKSDQDVSAAIFKYTLQTKKLSVVYRLPQDIASNPDSTRRDIFPPIVLSTDEKQLAFESADNPVFSVIKIADETGKSARVEGSFHFTQYPVWIPPVPTSNSAKADFASCNVSDKGWLNSINAKIDAGQWDALINEVNAQTGKKIDETCAYDLIAAATYLSGQSPATATSKP